MKFQIVIWPSLKVIPALLLTLASSFAHVASGQTISVDQDLRDNRSLLTELQSNLNDIGLTAGIADGMWGRNTEAALLQFRELYDLGPQTTLNSSIYLDVTDVWFARNSTPFVEPTELASFEQPVYRRPVFTVDVRSHDYDCSSCYITSLLLNSGDFTGDGSDEVIISHQADDGAQMLNQPTQITVLDVKNRAEVAFVGGANPHRVHAREATVADFNGDGLSDFFIASHGFDAPPYPGEQNVLVLASEGGLMDVSETHLPPLSDFAHGADSGDFDSDGDVDIIVITQADGDRTEPYLLINDGNANFEKSPLKNHLDDPLLVSFSSRNINRSDWSTARLLDYDQDGDFDLFLLSTGMSSRSENELTGVTGSIYLENDGSGNFSLSNGFEFPAGRWGFRTYTNDIDLMDLNNDGSNDVILTQSTESDRGWRGHYLQIFISSQDGRLVDQTHRYLWPQGYPGALERLNFADKTRVTDLNGDGRLDLITQSLSPAYRDSLENSGVVQIGLGLNDGTFAPLHPNEIVAGRLYSGRMPITGDFDGDGYSELITYDLVGQSVANDYQPFGVRLFLHDTNMR